MKKILNPEKVHRRPNYNQGILVTPGKLLFIAGQTAVDSKGNIVGKDNIEAQAKQVYENIKAILDEAGGTFDDIVKTTIYITDIKNREGLHKVRKKYFTGDQATSTLLVIKGLAREEFLMEIEAIAVIP
jgi:reactive intermediate/imine deaminase